MKILHSGKEVFVLDLGRVKIGESKEYEYMLENETKWDVEEIELSLNDIENKPVTEIEFLEAPKELKAYQKALLRFKWTPSIEIKMGLKTQLKIKALEIWR